MNEFKDKVVLITGASTGIGRATALNFASEGAKVVICDVNEDGGQKTLLDIKKITPDCLFINCDVSQEKEVKDLIQKTIDKFGRLDVAYNNAGVEGQPTSTTDCNAEAWDKIININLKGVWLCMKYEIQHMLKQGGGKIINCSSIAGIVGFEALPAYVASKHGVLGLTKTAALEYASKNIRVNALCPGVIETPMLTRFTQGHNEAMAEQVPMKRVGQPEEMANCVLWLASDKSSYVTGQALAADGGWIVH
jgi:NAD(P)-dependent dehydrogenase (short-subunit alcohol dehydrogenase family)